MALVAVIIETTHEDLDEAARSVMNGLKRAGYEHCAHVVNYRGGDELITLPNVRVALEYAEPEVLDASAGL